MRQSHALTSELLVYPHMQPTTNVVEPGRMRKRKQIVLEWSEMEYLMAIDTATVHLLSSALGSPVARKLFTTIANSRIAEIASLKETNPGADQALDTLERAGLISIGQSGKSYFVTAKGLKVVRDLEQLANV
jgi:hypothetical protein